MTWLLNSIVDGVINYWALCQVALIIRTYRDINALEDLNNGNQDSDDRNV